VSVNGLDAGQNDKAPVGGQVLPAAGEQPAGHRNTKFVALQQAGGEVGCSQ